ncbi:MAG: radical SAM protein [Desulfosarcinaceae bacterium]
MSEHTVAFSRHAANVFFHILTQCNLHCRHCYINPGQHGKGAVSLETARHWLEVLIRRSPGANLVLLGGEPTLHPELAPIIKAARSLDYASVTIDTNGYLFHHILDRVTPAEVDFFSFSLDGATAATNDAIRGQGVFDVCTEGVRQAKSRGFKTSLIYTVSNLNIGELSEMPPLLSRLGVDHFFIQVIGLRGQSAADDHLSDLQLTRDQWMERIPGVARQVAGMGIPVTYPKVFLDQKEPFSCAGRVADNYFVFPNGRVYRCPLCEDYPLHSLVFDEKDLCDTPKINESDLFELEIPEGCVMNKLVQPRNIVYLDDGRPAYKIAGCLLKEEVLPPQGD